MSRDPGQIGVMCFAHRGRLVALVVAGALAGCSTATISRNYGPNYEARITGSDARSLRVRDGNGYDFVIPREDVREVDHPGNVLLTIGAIVVGLYAPLTIEAASSHHGGEWVDPAVTVFGAMAMTGFGLVVGGLVPYLGSKRAAAAFEDANPVLPVLRPVHPFAPPGPWTAPAAPSYAP